MDAQNPDWDEPYNKLKLAWTWLLTHPGASLIYYGDEVVARLSRSRQSTDDAVGLEHMLGVQSVVEVLANERDYPQLTSENRTLWWEDYNSTGVVVSDNDQHAIVLLNRSSDSITVSNPCLDRTAD